VSQVRHVAEQGGSAPRRMRACGRLAGLSLLLVPLAACVATPDHTAETVLAGVVAQHRAAIAASSGAPAARTAAPLAQRPATGAAAALIGATPDRVTARLGQPDLRRAEGSAEVWRYSAAHCHLDLVLYPEGGSLRVGHAAARAAGLTARSEGECLADIAARPAPRPQVVAAR
jgi:hypothetical protein